MPGIFDFLSGAAGDLFGGGGDSGGDPFGGDPWSSGGLTGSDPTNLFGGIDPNLLSGGDPSNPFGYTDPSNSWSPMNVTSITDSTGGLTPMPVQTIDPNAFTSVTPLPNANAGTPLNPTQINPLQLLGLGSGGGGGGATGGGNTNGTIIPQTNPLTTLPNGGNGVTQPASGGTGAPSGGGSGTGLPNGASNLFGSGLSLTQLLAGLGLGGALLNGNQTPPGQSQLQALADSNQQLVNNQIMPTALANQQGNVNGQVLTSVNNQLKKSEAAMRQRYAEMGMSGSTMEEQDLAGLRANAEDQIFSIGQQMATTGLQTAASLTNQDATIYNEIMQAQVQQDEELSKAIAAFAGAMAK